MRDFASQLQDRFGKLPNEVIALIDSVRLKWAGKELGMEKIVLSEDRMRCYFPGDPNAALYLSPVFAQIMGYVVENSSTFSVKQTEKALIVNVNRISNIFEALHVLDGWKKFINSKIETV